MQKNAPLIRRFGKISTCDMVGGKIPTCDMVIGKIPTCDMTTGKISTRDLVMKKTCRIHAEKRTPHSAIRENLDL